VADDPAFTHPGLDNCRVTFCGNRVAIWVRQGGDWQRYDLLTEVTIDDSDPAAGITVSGTSSILRNQVGVPDGDATVSLTIHQTKGCTTCN